MTRRNNLDAVEFVAVYGSGEAQRRTRKAAIDGKYRRRHRNTFKQFCCRPGQSLVAARCNLLSEEIERLCFVAGIGNRVCERAMKLLLRFNEVFSNR